MRDPRIDPRIGDSVLVRRRQRTVYCLYVDGSIGWATESPLASGRATIAQWRRWAGQEGSAIIIHAPARNR